MPQIALSSIVFDAGTQIRAALNESVVTEYAERMAEGAQFPAITLFHDGNAYYLADGFHRAMAAQRNGRTEIEATVQPGAKSDALWFALGANRSNGQRLTVEDKRHAIILALQAWPDRSQNEIAAQIGVNQSSVQRVRAEVMRTHNLPSRVTGRDGKSYPASRPAPAHDARMETIAEMVKSGKSNDEINAAIGVNRHDLIAQVRRGMGVGSQDRSKAAVAQRRQDIRAMAERGFSTRQIAAEIGIDESSVGVIAKREGIVIHADRLMARTKRHDSNRIVEQMVIQAENLTADVNLIDFADLDRARLAEWLESLQDSRNALGGFIRRLMKEQQSHVEVA